MSQAAERTMAQPDTAEVAVQMIGVHKWYGQFHVLKDINLTVDAGERIVICGPSGSDKSTMIRCGSPAAPSAAAVSSILALS